MLAIQERLNQNSDSTPFERLLRDAGRRALSARTLAEQIETLVGFDGRLPVRFGIDSLTTWQTALYERLGARAGAVEVQDRAALPAEAIVLGVRSGYGRIVLAPLEWVTDDDILFGYFLLSPEERRIVEERRQELELTHRRFDAELDAFFADEAAAAAALSTIASAIDRIDPVLLYIRDETFTNIPSYNNLLKGRGGKDGDYLCDELAQRPPSSWPWEAKSFVFCMHLLQSAGFRGEEFNGRQLTPFHVSKFFDEAIERFASVLPNRERPGRESPAATKARFLSAARAEIAKSHTFYRHVNGISLLKLQDFYASDEVKPLALGELASPVTRYLAQFTPVDAERSLAEVFRRFIAATVDEPLADSSLRAHPIEVLLLRMVSAATEELHSDVGMSRCLRQLGNLARVHDQDLVEEANGWPQSEYFCAVAPSRSMVERMKGRDKQLADILKAISARMRYNSWHYIPGHFPLDRKDPDRHFYLPPAMSDTAEWSDQHHRGHIAAGVRYSIRSPGPLTYRGKRYTGFYDLRLMRCAGQPYTLAELKAANRHSMTLGLFFQALLDVIVEKASPFRVTAFANQWFDGVPWSALHVNG